MAILTDNDGHTPLDTAVFLRNIEILKLLIENGAYPNIAGECSRETTQCKTYIRIKAKDGITPFQRAAWNGDLGILEILIASGADPNKAGE